MHMPGVGPAPRPSVAADINGPHRTVRSAGRLRDVQPSFIFALLCVIAIAVVAPLVVAAATGNLSIPHNDGWAYSRVALVFARTGHYEQFGWGSPFSVTQEITLAPLYTSLVGQQLSVVVSALVSVVATWVLLREMTSPAMATFATAVVFAFPGFGLLATSFMEDVPAYCATVLSLILGLHAMRSRSFSLLCASVLVSLWGALTREPAAAPAIAFLIVALVQWPEPRMRRRVWALTIAFVLVVVLGELWRRSLPNSQGADVNLAKAVVPAVQLFSPLAFSFCRLASGRLNLAFGADPRGA